MNVRRFDRPVLFFAKPGRCKQRPALCSGNAKLARIAYVYKIEPVGRCSNSCKATIPGFKYLTNPFDSSLVGPDSDQCPRDIPDHMMQKGISLYVQNHELAFAGDTDCLQKADR